MSVDVTDCGDCPFMYSNSECEDYQCRVPGSKVQIHRKSDRYMTAGRYKLETWLGTCPLLDGPVVVQKKEKS